MCRVCEQVKDLSPQAALQAIGKAGKMTPHLSKLLDRVLGTQVETEVDSAREAEAFRAMKRASDEE